MCIPRLFYVSSIAVNPADWCWFRFGPSDNCACVNYIPIIDAPVEAEVEGTEVSAISHHLHHCLVVQL